MSFCALQLALDTANMMSERQQQLAQEHRDSVLNKVQVDLQRLKVQLAKKDGQVAKLKLKVAQVRVLQPLQPSASGIGSRAFCLGACFFYDPCTMQQ